MNSIIKYLLPNKLKGNERNDAKALIVISFVQCIAGIVFAPIYYFLGHTNGALIVVGGTVAALATPFILYLTENLSSSKHIPATSFYLTIAGLVYVQSGIHATSLPWFIAVPVIALFTLGIRQAIFWGALSSLAILSFYVIEIMGIALPVNPLTSEKSTLMLMLGNSVLVLYIMGFGIASRSLRNSLIAKIYDMANKDMLTGLPTLRLAVDRLDIAIANAKRKTCKVGLLFIDLDGFKQVNDTHGHEAGDEVLIQIGNRLKQILREADTACRIGGDEFLVILSDMESQNIAEMVCERIIDQVNLPIPFSNSNVKVGCSIGVALYPDHSEDALSLRKMADSIMYEVKKSGKNNYRIANNT